MASLYETCGDLFAQYPLAVDRDTDSMVLALPHDDTPRFFVLSQDRDQYSLWAWGGEDIAVIPARGDALRSSQAAVILAGAFPVPRDGSLLGWVTGRAVTAVVTFRSWPEDVPVFSDMPQAEADRADWPSFIGEPVLGPWVWDYYRAGRLVDLAGVIADSESAVYWVDTAKALGSSCMAVARDLAAGGGVTFPAGRYVYHRVLADGVPVPSLGALLADPSALDLASRFRAGAR